MARDDLIDIENAKVTGVCRGIFTVTYMVGDQEMTARCTLAGRLIKHKIRVVLGDIVHVRLSPADTSVGIIYFRPRS